MVHVTGKTTLADVLVASNGIISQRMAGKVSAYKAALFKTLHCMPSLNISRNRLVYYSAPLQGKGTNIYKYFAIYDNNAQF